MILLKNRTITFIHIVAMSIMFLFVLLFIFLVIYEEYTDFDKEALAIRKAYLQKQKETITFDVNRVLDFIAYRYEHKEDTMNEEELKLNIIHAIEKLYGRPDKTGYIFIYDFNGVKLSDPMQGYNIGQNLYDFKDSNGVAVIKDLITVSKRKEGGFVEYRWRKPTTGEEASKISFAKSFQPWGWMLGTGVYFDEVEKLITIERNNLRDRLIKYMMEILSLAVILFGLGWISVMVVNRIIGKEIDTFSNFFKQTSMSHSTIEMEEIHLLEFRKMVNYVNSMVNEIHTQKSELEEMNSLLEKRVEKKTEYLKAQNTLLVKEKNFNESLVKAQDSFIKHAIHEINTPLAVIITHIDIFKMKFGENRYLSKIEAGTKIIANIYDDLSYMVKKNRFVYEKERMNFSTFLESRIYFFDEIALGNYHTIVSHIESNIMIEFSEVELQRVIDNNLSNAIKYAKKNSEIVVKLSKQSKQIVLEFITQSKKIEDTKRIFEPFHQEEDLKGGFGLGLEIVGSICNKEHIKIDVKSTDEITVFKYLF
jgi:signal transduction histidine kinase